MKSDIDSFFDDKEEIDEQTFYDIIEYGIHVSELYMKSYVSNMANYNFDDDFEENIMQMIIEQYGKQYDLYMKELDKIAEANNVGKIPKNIKSLRCRRIPHIKKPSINFDKFKEFKPLEDEEEKKQNQEEKSLLS